MCGKMWQKKCVIHIVVKYSYNAIVVLKNDMQNDQVDSALFIYESWCKENKKFDPSH